MPVKSWSFEHSGCRLRLEVFWRFFGAGRQRLYVDHHLAASSHGLFQSSLSYLARGDPSSFAKIQSLVARFPWKRLGRERECVAFVNSQPVDWNVTPVLVETLPSPVVEEAIPVGTLVAVLLLLVSCALLSVLFVLGLVLMPLATLARLLRHRAKSARLRKQFRQLGRYLPETEAHEKLAKSSGTLLLETDGLHPLRAWWTADDVVALCPFPTSPNERHAFPREGPFAQWCAHYYLSQDTGVARLTGLQRALLCEWQAESDQGRLHEHPNVSVVAVTSAAQRGCEKIPEFVRRCTDDGKPSVPALLEALYGEDRDTARMAISLLRALGADARSALPQLIERLQAGPLEDRFELAIVIAGLGEKGVQALMVASEADDPWLAREAKAGLEYVNYLGAASDID